MLNVKTATDRLRTILHTHFDAAATVTLQNGRVSVVFQDDAAARAFHACFEEAFNQYPFNDDHYIPQIRGTMPFYREFLSSGNSFRFPPLFMTHHAGRLEDFNALAARAALSPPPNLTGAVRRENEAAPPKATQLPLF